MRRISAGLVTIVVFALSAQAASFDKPWHIRVPRQTLLEAWQRLRTLDVPGVATDWRFQITGATRFASPDGDDANPGTADKPWRTLQKACTSLRPGMVVYLRAGTYHGSAPDIGLFETGHPTGYVPSSLPQPRRFSPVRLAPSSDRPG
jgi:hypothetical protein